MNAACLTNNVVKLQCAIRHIQIQVGLHISMPRFKCGSCIILFSIDNIFDISNFHLIYRRVTFVSASICKLYRWRTWFVPLDHSANTYLIIVFMKPSTQTKKMNGLWIPTTTRLSNLVSHTDTYCFGEQNKRHWKSAGWSHVWRLESGGCVAWSRWQAQ